MKISIKLAVLAALFASSFAVNGSIKQKLGETARKNLAEVGADANADQSMSCGLPAISAPNLTFCPGSTGAPPPPVSGSGTSTVFDSVVTAQQG